MRNLNRHMSCLKGIGWCVCDARMDLVVVPPNLEGGRDGRQKEKVPFNFNGFIMLA